MSRYFQFILVVCYACLSVAAIFIALRLFGLLPKNLHEYTVVLATLAWLLFCFTAAFFITDIWLLFQDVRRPVRVEEQRLRECLDELLRRTGDTTIYRFRVQEEMGFNAFAVGYHTIVVSKGLLLTLTDDELTAVLAHELGHLRTKDGIAGMAYTCATFVPRVIVRCLKKGLTLMALPVRFSLTGGIIGLVVILLLFYYYNVFRYLIVAVIFIAFITALEWFFLYLWLLNSRQTEYRQDAFAHRLGFGEELRGVLLRMTENMPRKVSFFYTLSSTHPVIFNRIRRLERLEEAGNG